MNSLKILKSNIGIYLPSLFFQLGTSLSLAFNPLWSREMGASVAMVGVIAAAQGIRNLLFDLPLGWLGGKIKDNVYLSAALGGVDAP